MKRIKVWDLTVRLFHWSLALFVLIAFLTAEEDETIPWHARVGLAVLGLVVFRLVWGLVGTPYARFSAFVRSPREVIAYAKSYLRGSPPLHISHNPLGAVMVVTLLAALVGVTVTGLLTYLGPLYGGPLLMGEGLAEGLEEVHEAFAAVLPWLIGAHVVGVVVSSFLERQNLVKGMVDGYKRAPDDELAPRFGLARKLAAFVVAMAVSGGAVIGLALLFPIAEADAAAPPRSLLDEASAVTGLDGKRGDVQRVDEDDDTDGDSDR